MRTYKARGIVLHTIKYGDSSAIAYLFTDVLGRMSYMVQGIRSKRGRGNKAALLQPMFLVEFEGVEQPHAQMHRIREMCSLRPLMSVPFDVRKSTISMFMAEVLYRLIREVEANEPLFDFLCEAVLKLDAMREGIANYHLWFLVRLSAYLGFYPGNEYIENGCFDIRGGLFTPSMPAHRIGMNEACARLLGTLMECEADALAEILFRLPFRFDPLGPLDLDPARSFLTPRDKVLPLNTASFAQIPLSIPRPVGQSSGPGIKRQDPLPNSRTTAADRPTGHGRRRPEIARRPERPRCTVATKRRTRTDSSAERQANGIRFPE